MKKYFIGVTVFFVAIVAGVFLIIQDKPALLEGVDFSQAIYDHQHHLLRLTLTKDEQYRLYTPLTEIAPQLIEATVLKEDRHFYTHTGVDFSALASAIWQTYVLRHYRRGASTLTMQTARLRYHLNTHTWWGKLRQIILAMQLEHHYSKQQILEAYFNLAPYGDNIQGIGAASLIYYHCPPDRLTLPQVLTLSVIPQNPGKRQLNHLNYAWMKIARLELLTQWLKVFPQDATLTPLVDLPLVNYNRKQLPFLAPHFVNEILQNKSLNTDQSVLITTLNLRWQQVIENTLNSYVQSHSQQGIHNAAVLLVDTNDLSVQALIGSANFYDADLAGQVNGTLALRSPGSTLKPFIYGLAIDQGLIYPQTVLKDAPTAFGDYNPENFDGEFLGPLTAKDALIMSRNIPALDLANQLNNPTFYQFLQQTDSALKPESNYGLALVLGGAEITMQHLAELYAMLANQGVYHSLRFLPSQPVSPDKRLLSPEASFLVLDMLKDNPRPGSGSHPNSIPIAWKTGTSSGYRDAWAAGVFSHYVLVVWVGNFSGAGNPAFTGRDAAGLLFFNIIDRLTSIMPPLRATTTDWRGLHLKKIAVCQASGMLPTPACPHTVLTWFIPGKSPIHKDTVYREVMINPKTGLHACHFDSHNVFAVYEFWPSDLLKIFQQAGIARRSPPLYEPGCEMATVMSSSAPKITSPKIGLKYAISPGQSTAKIPLTAVTDGDVTLLHWFVDQTYLGQSNRDTIIWLTAKPGQYIVRVVDDHSRTDSLQLTVSASVN